MEASLNITARNLLSTSSISLPKTSPAASPTEVFLYKGFMNFGEKELTRRGYKSFKKVATLLAFRERCSVAS
ncbi:hypothetical protein F0562_028974 [Nyssa sinensis]|uniref:Uncharacterized protein n=1 Tax=Nyssa sinensis TaxID=561372 RepID=A0A5J5B2M7_9ASTE|nr:hypothetical protein F0562_028974 [Nyssa sinensis]